VLLQNPYLLILNQPYFHLRIDHKQLGQKASNSGATGGVIKIS